MLNIIRVLKYRACLLYSGDEGYKYYKLMMITCTLYLSQCRPAY